ncbi:hypothetical protein DFP72DRAFT_894585 [Ephemerocybe angulata]|uniref:Uncharacterized protein n=1 Tax=Ephemerocybe angulata TaxID=980116 RepID=A0A8H6I185_9AGAR|nr:hypothetical protein DFP72DRAFT_894585 [Tulosesus angulatus]
MGSYVAPAIVVFAERTGVPLSLSAELGFGVLARLVLFVFILIAPLTPPYHHRVRLTLCPPPYPPPHSRLLTTLLSRRVCVFRPAPSPSAPLPPPSPFDAEDEVVALYVPVAIYLYGRRVWPCATFCRRRRSLGRSWSSHRIYPCRCCFRQRTRVWVKLCGGVGGGSPSAACFVLNDGDDGGM